MGRQLKPMWTTEIPTYVIDLQQKAEVRWAKVIAQETLASHQLADEAQLEFEHVPEAARWLFRHLYNFSGGRYQSEITAWAKALNISAGTATLLNCLYELSHVPAGGWAAKVLGCTAGVRWFEDYGWVHVRTLDWALTNLGNATRLFRFQNQRREFISVGFTGFVGVLSGMLPGRYSVTINWAPPVVQPVFNFGPLFCFEKHSKNATLMLKRLKF